MVLNVSRSLFMRNTLKPGAKLRGTMAVGMRSSAALGGTRLDCPGRRGQHAAEVDEDRPRLRALDEAARVEIERLHVRRRRQAGHHDLCPLEHFLSRAGLLRAGRDQVAHGVGVLVEYGERKGLQHVTRHRVAHVPYADEAYGCGHVWSPRPGSYRRGA